MTQHIFRRFRLFAIAGLLQLWVAAYGQDAGVTSFEVPAGGTLYEQVTLGKTEMKSISGEVMYSYPLALKPTEGKLPKIKVKVALPKGKTLKSVGTLIVNIPPGGSAPILAQATCANLGVGSAAIQSAAKHDWPYLASLGLAVAEYARKQNPRVKVIFAGFSAGGFAAELATYHDVTRTSGLIQIGSFPMTGNNALPPTCPSVILVGQGDFNLEQASTALQVQSVRGAKIELLTHSGGHSWGTQADQGRAIKTLLGVMSGQPQEGLRPGTNLTPRLLTLKARDAIREIGPPFNADYGVNIEISNTFDWKKALVSKDFPHEFPEAVLTGGSWYLTGFAVPSQKFYVNISFLPRGNKVQYQTFPESVPWKDVVRALKLPNVSNAVERSTRLWTLQFGDEFTDYEVEAMHHDMGGLLTFALRGQQTDINPTFRKVTVSTSPQNGNQVSSIGINFPPTKTVPAILSALGLSPENVTVEKGRIEDGQLEAWNVKPKRAVPRLDEIDLTKLASHWYVAIRPSFR